MAEHSTALEHPTEMETDEIKKCLKSTFQGLMKSNESSLQICLAQLTRNSGSYVKSGIITDGLRAAFK